MKTRQYHQLGSLPVKERDALLVEGLEAIGETVTQMAAEIYAADSAGCQRAAHLLANVCREEAGKFLLLLDTYRVHPKNQKVISKQYGRASKHLAKLLYAQLADYSVGSRSETAALIESHRELLYLDGPSDVDFIYRNELLFEREQAMYVDLIDTEGTLKWWPPTDVYSASVDKSVRLVEAIAASGLLTIDGVRALRSAWNDFDHDAETKWSEWNERNLMALAHVTDGDENQARAAAFAAREWPMPLITFDLSPEQVTVEDLVAKREQVHNTFLADEFGPGE